MAIGGSNFVHIQTSRIAELDYAVQGFPFSDPTQAGIIGIRKEGKLDLTGVVRNDAVGKDQYDAVLAKLEIEAWQTDYTSFKNYYLLGMALNQYRVKTSAGDWWNFVKNTASPPFGTPNGFCLLGLTFDYEVTPTELSAKLHLAGKAHPKEFDWAAANTASGATGGSSGTSISGLSRTAYDQSHYGIPGIESIVVGSDNLGELEEPKISLKAVENYKTTREQPITRFVQVDIEGSMLQSMANPDVQAVLANRNSDFTTTVNLWNGMILVFANSVSWYGEPHYGDDKMRIPFHFRGKIPYDINGASTNISFNDATSTVTFNRIGYV